MLLRQMSNEIDRYLSVMPKSNSYSTFKQEETRNILVTVCQTLEIVKPHHILLPDLKHCLESIRKWDGVHFLDEDMEFQMLLDKIRKDLMQVRKLSSI